MNQTLKELQVLLFGHELLHLVRVIESRLEDPMFLSILVHQCRVVPDLIVHAHNLTIHRGVDVSSNLNALNSAHRVRFLELQPHFRRLNVHDIAQLLLCVVCDAHMRQTTSRIESNPFMLVSVLHESREPVSWSHDPKHNTQILLISTRIILFPLTPMARKKINEDFLQEKFFDEEDANEQAKPPLDDALEVDPLDLYMAEVG